jgi:hypothetical protein
MKNIIAKIIHRGWIFAISLCYLTCEASLEAVVRVQQGDSSTAPFPIDDAGVQSLGVTAKSNILSYDGKLYVNWFFPILNIDGYQCFADVCVTKDRSFQLQAIAANDNPTLIKYIGFLRSYLDTLSVFYPQAGRWNKQKNKILELLGRLRNDIRAGRNISQVRQELSSLTVWPCMHTEPICVFDHIKNGSGFLELESSDFNFSEDPIVMYSRWRPCSMSAEDKNKWECLEMLQEVARRIGQNINFRYYY